MKIHARNLSFGYNTNRMVLNNIGFSVDGESVITIVGASGSGKSTFLRLLSGIITPSKSVSFSGEISIDGHSPRNFTLQGLTGFMFQENTLMPHLSVIQNLLFPLKLRKDKNAVSKAEEMLSLVGLSEFRNYLPYQLSGGMKARIDLAKSFITKPKMLLLDEPFGSLDIRWKSQLYAELETFRRLNDVKIILVTHDIQEALLLSDRILVFGRQGTVLGDFAFEKLGRLSKTEEYMNGREQEFFDIRNLIVNE